MGKQCLQCRERLQLGFVYVCKYERSAFMSVCVRGAICPSGPVISHEDLIELIQNNNLCFSLLHSATHTDPSAGTAIDRQDGKCNSSPISNWSNVFSVTV